MNTKKFSDAMSKVDSRYVDEAIQYKKKNAQKPVWLKLGAMVACLCLVAVSAFTVNHLTGNRTVPPLELVTPASDAPTSMKKLMNYNGYRYNFMENGATYNLSSKQLGDVLGTLEHDIQADPQTNGKKEFSSTFALGGTIYEMTDYNSVFRVAVELDGNYYICQNAGLTDNTPMDISEYFEAAQFPEIIDEISIYDHAGREMLAKIPEKEIVSLIDTLAQAKPADLSDDEYQQIGKAQKEGQSYQLFLSLSDGTVYQLYVIPSLDITMLAGGRYTLPENFAEDFGHLFDGLVQKALPAQ